MYIHHVINICSCFTIKILDFPCSGFSKKENELDLYLNSRLATAHLRPQEGRKYAMNWPIQLSLE